MRVLLSGASGLVGRQVAAALKEEGHACAVLRRGDGLQGGISWDPSTGRVTNGSLEEFDSVIHLAGENIADGRWTAGKKARIRDSRVGPTRRLAEHLATLTSPPKSFLCASAVGFYGDRGGDVLDENSPVGRGFLPDLCREWESAAASAHAAGIRVCHLRFGAVLSTEGGALAKMLPPFKLGLGGRLGGGHQWFSWVAIDDVVGAILHAMGNAQASGPLNVVAPHPVTNAEFTKTLARVLGRPALLPVPEAALRLLFGEMADAVLLASAQVRPEALLVTGFRFKYPELEPALRHLIGK